MQIRDTDRILVVAPHPDDESIGCGGLLALYGQQCDVLLLTDGRLGKSKNRKDLSDAEIIDTRLNELRHAMKLCNIRELITLGIPDSEVKTHKKVIFSVNLSCYDLVFVPNAHEAHPDHFYACKYIKQMRLLGRTRAKVYEYEVWTPLRTVDWLLDISTVESVKVKMIEQYASQLECMDYLHSGMGLSHYRGIGCRTSAAEAFYRSPVTPVNKTKRMASLMLRAVKR